MRLAETRGALRRNLAGTPSDWTDEVLDGGIARAIDDLDRVMPLEKIADFTLTFAITDEVVASGALDVAVTLANKRIRAKSDSVKSTDGLTTYTRDTDFTMDYAAGTITPLSTGAIPASTDFHITYAVLEVYIDLSGLTDLIRIARMEYPAGNVPSEFQSFYTWGDFLVVTSRGRDTQGKMAEKDHVWLYYHAKHTSPAVEEDGSWHLQLDEVVIKGAEGYSILTKALELRHLAGMRLTQANTTLGELAAISTKIATSLTNTQTQASSASSDLSDIDAKLDDMVAALAAAAGFLASAGSSLTLAETQAGVAATDISAAVTSQLADAATRLATVDALITKISTLADNAKSTAAKADFPLASARSALGQALPIITAGTDGLVDVAALRVKSEGVGDKGGTRLTKVANYLETAVDALMNALSTDVLDPIATVTSRVTVADKILTDNEGTIDKVNVGEVVSEMYRRYADSWNGLARMEYDAWLTFLGRVDRLLTQGSAIVGEAAEYRAEADTLLATAGVALAQINALLSQVSGFHDQAARETDVAQAFNNEGQVIVGSAGAVVGAAGRGIEQANSFIASATVRLNAASESSNLVNAYVAVAAQHVNMAQVKIAEGNALATPVDAILGRVSRKIEIASIFQQESDRLLQELNLKQQESDRYVALAVGESDLADKFELTGARIKTEFMAILTDRAQVRTETALTPVRQEAP